MIVTHHRLCRECGAAFDADPRALFCSEACRVRFNRRRRERGTELYDVLMAAHYDRDAIGTGGLGIATSMMAAYRASDICNRAGRQSWQPYSVAQTRIPMAYGKEGDKR